MFIYIFGVAYDRLIGGIGNIRGISPCDALQHCHYAATPEYSQNICGNTVLVVAQYSGWQRARIANVTKERVIA